MCFRLVETAGECVIPETIDLCGREYVCLIYEILTGEQCSDGLFWFRHSPLLSVIFSHYAFTTRLTFNAVTLIVSFVSI